MRVSASATAGVAVLALAGCGGDPEPPATVSRLAPSAAYSDFSVAATITGGPFRPSYTIDVGGGSASIQPTAFTAWLLPWAEGRPAEPLEDMTWKSTTEIATEIPAGVPPGFYDVELQDPRGNITILDGGFQSLGPDRDPPRVTIDSPASGSLVVAATDVPVMMHVDDGRGRIVQVDWTVTWRGAQPQTGTCEVRPDATQTPCSFTFTAPTLDVIIDTLTISGVAVDAQGNSTTATAQVQVGLRPTVLSFVPSAGPTTGMIDIVVLGANFIGRPDGTRIFLGGVEVGPITFKGSGQMRATIPPHDPGLVPLVVKTAGTPMLSSGFFDYVAQPDIRVLAPDHGPSRGGTPVQIGGAHFRPATRIFFGTPPDEVELVCPVFVNEHLITGLTPPGHGSASVAARDPIAGDSVTGNAFTYVDALVADAGPDQPDADTADAPSEARMEPTVCPPPPPPPGGGGSDGGVP